MAAGLLVLSLAFFSFSQTAFRRAGVLSLLATSFVVVWLLTDSILLGLLSALSWLLLPWLELLTRVRKMRLPAECHLRQSRAPNDDTFPLLEPLTSELEALGFEQTEDIGWEWEDTRQSYRLFRTGKGDTMASVCFTEQSGASFAWLAFTSRSLDGGIWTTWNYPLSYTLQTQPDLHLHRVSAACGPREMQEAHEAFLSRQGIQPDARRPMDGDHLQETVADGIAGQIRHNMETGILEPVDGGQVRYTLRGLFFVWRQFLKDLAGLR